MKAIKFGAASLLFAFTGPAFGFQTTGTDRAYFVEQKSKAVPKAFHGVWTTERGKCRPQSLTRLTIHSGGIAQAEGAATTKSVSVGEPREILVELSNSGGGGEWESLQIWRVTKDGKTLVMEDRPDGRRQTLWRCAR